VNKACCSGPANFVFLECFSFSFSFSFLFSFPFVSSESLFTLDHLGACVCPTDSCQPAIKHGHEKESAKRLASCSPFSFDSGLPTLVNLQREDNGDLHTTLFTPLPLQKKKKKAGNEQKKDYNLVKIRYFEHAS
jgi:hypothetical protein